MSCNSLLYSSMLFDNIMVLAIVFIVSFSFQGFALVSLYPYYITLLCIVKCFFYFHSIIFYMSIIVYVLYYCIYNIYNRVVFFAVFPGAVLVFWSVYVVSYRYHDDISPDRVFIDSERMRWVGEKNARTHTEGIDKVKTRVYNIGKEKGE